MHLYLVFSRGRTLGDIAAAIELLKECHRGKCVGPAPYGMGLVYETPHTVPDKDAEVIGIVDWN